MGSGRGRAPEKALRGRGGGRCVWGVWGRPPATGPCSGAALLRYGSLEVTLAENRSRRKRYQSGSTHG